MARTTSPESRSTHGQDRPQAPRSQEERRQPRETAEQLTEQQASVHFTVGEEDTADALGSGDLPVLATPRLLAWAEAATCAAIAAALPEGRTSVGSRVRLDHLAASPVGAELSVTARVVYVDPPPGSGPGRLYRFEVVAEHTTDGKVVGHGEVTRVVVDRSRFLSRL